MSRKHWPTPRRKDGIAGNYGDAPFDTTLGNAVKQMNMLYFLGDGSGLREWREVVGSHARD